MSPARFKSRPDDWVLPERAEPLARIPATRMRDTHQRQGGGDELKMAEQLLDLGMRCAVKPDSLDDLEQHQPDETGHGRGQNNQRCRPLEGRHAAGGRRAPALPEVHDDGNHGAGMEHDHSKVIRGEDGSRPMSFSANDDMG